MPMFDHHDPCDLENSSPALFGFDLFQFITFRLWPCALDLAVLPRWFLALEITFTSRGKVLAGRVFSRGIYLEMRGPLADGQSYPLWLTEKDEDGTLYFGLGRLFGVVDHRREAQTVRAVG